MKKDNKNLLSKFWRAIIEFDMIKKNDRILIGLSGGKDSLFLTWALSQIKKVAPVNFDLFAFNIDTGFAPSFPQEKLYNFCNAFDIPLTIEKIDVPALQKNKNDTPCYTCSYFRRGAANRIAQNIGCNKIALAHNNDDAVETFFMNIILSGQVKTFLPTTYLSRKKVTVIRPLLLYRESEIIKHIEHLNFEPLKNPCPHDGNTMREKVKDHLLELESIFPKAYDNLSVAMRTTKTIELWPTKKSKEENIKDFRNFWDKNK